MSDDKQSCESCSSTTCSAKGKTESETDKDFKERQDLARRMCQIKRKIFVLSGKGGVGKSSVAANLAISLARLGRTVGVLDIDLHGPSIPRLFGLEGADITAVDDTIRPVVTDQNVRVMSVGFMLRTQDDAIIWRGPLKHGIIKQFLKDVEWGELDYLIIDSPPGTGDEPLSVAQLIDDADGVVVVTTPQVLAITDVRKSISFTRQLNLPVLGVVENMSGFICPECGTRTDLFGSGGGREMATDMGVPFLGEVPIDPGLVAAGDSGELPAYLSGSSAGALAFADIVKALVATVERE